MKTTSTTVQWTLSSTLDFSKLVGELSRLTSVGPWSVTSPSRDDGDWNTSVSNRNATEIVIHNKQLVGLRSIKRFS